MIYGYSRVSTKQQFKDGTYKQQMDLLKQNNVPDDNIFFDNLSGGNMTKRVSLNKLLETIQVDDTVVVTKLDRLARNVADALEISKIIADKGATLNILDLGVIDNKTPQGKLIYTVFSAFAEFERNLTNERMQNGRQYKRENDPEYREGRKLKINTNQLKYIHQHFEDGKLTNREIADMFGVSLRTIMTRKREWRDLKDNKNTEKG